MKFSPIFIFLFLLVLTPFISAQQPPNIQTNINVNTGLQVEFPQIFVFENGKDYLFTTHVFNISTGLGVTNDTTTCFFHLFDNRGAHQIDEVAMTFDPIDTDFDYNVLGANFTRNGEYFYLITCNTTEIGGFDSVGFEVTQDGFESIVFPQQFSVIALGIILIMFGVLRERYTLSKQMGSLILMVMGVLTLYPGYNNISHTSLFGLVLGSTLIAMGFWFFIEHYFSRTKQEERFNQDQGEQEEDLE